MKIILVDRSRVFCEEASNAFKELPNIEVVNDRFENLPPFDCMVSPANSFGLMDGGWTLPLLNFSANS